MNLPRDGECAIWGVEATTSRNAAFIWQYRCRRAGGCYQIDIQAWQWIQSTDNILRAKLTSWIVDQHRSGDEWPLITADVCAAINARHSLRLSNRIARFLGWVEFSGFRPGNSISMNHGDTSTLDEISAWTECVSEDEAAGFLNLLENSGFLNWDTGEIDLTLDGWKALEAAVSVRAAVKQVFVAMWFNDETQAAYDQGIAPALKQLGYDAIRIDQKEHNNKIDDEIIAEIRRSRFVVADFTCGIVGQGNEETAVPRGGVYYEAGFAQGLGIPVIWAVRADQIKHVHFDTRQFNHITWTTPEELRHKLYNRVAAVIGDNSI